MTSTNIRQFVTLADDVKLAYWDIGAASKRPLLLIHGHPGTAQSHLGNLITHLQQNHRLIAPDLRGYGASQPPQRDFPPHFYQRDADDMAALLQHLNCGPVIVLGFSDGSESAILLAASHPELVRGVIGWGIAGVIAPEMLSGVQSWLSVPDKANWDDRHKQIAALHGEAQVPTMLSGWATAAGTISANGGNICLKEAAQVQCPVLLINGDGDTGNPLPDVRRLAARLPQGRLEIVANSGHAIQFDQPDILMWHIDSFLEQLEK